MDLLEPVIRHVPVESVGGSFPWVNTQNTPILSLTKNIQCRHEKPQPYPPQKLPFTHIFILTVFYIGVCEI